MNHRRPKISLALRIVAAGCIVVWLAAGSFCGLGSLFCCDSFLGETVLRAGQEVSHETHTSGIEDAPAETAHHSHHAEAHHSHHANAPAHSSHKHDSEESQCCSTLMAMVQTGETVVFTKPVLHPLSFLGIFAETRPSAPVLSENPRHGQARPPDWVLTPEVCLGPAHRSLAPPSLA